jgi:hypothetical protein
MQGCRMTCLRSAVVRAVAASYIAVTTWSPIEQPALSVLDPVAPEFATIAGVHGVVSHASGLF